jgi:hypothetical protein
MAKRSRKYIGVYKQYYGEIPKDELGRSYDIHHIDGDHTNNDPSNLVALPINEHYNVHKKQCEWGAAWAILKRIKVDPEEVRELARQMNIENAKNGKHWSQISSKNGTHPFQNLEFQKYMAEQAKLRGNRSCDKLWTCEICGCSGKGATNYSRYHGENCGRSSLSKGKIWINNGTVSKMIDVIELADFLEQGWTLGRGLPDITKRRTNKLGTTGRASSYVRKTSRPYNKKEKNQL